MTASRKELVERLVHFDAPLTPTLSALQEFGWDCDEPLVTLDAASVRSVLQRYLSGVSTPAADVESWASAIECRDDIEASGFRDMIFERPVPPSHGSLRRCCSGFVGPDWKPCRLTPIKPAWSRGKRIDTRKVLKFR